MIKQFLRTHTNIELAKAKTCLVSNISHDLRTPMNTIMGFTDLVLLTDLTDIQRENLERVKGSSVKLLSTLNNLIIDMMDGDIWMEDRTLHLNIKIDE